jgi:hypothetical protein
MGKRSLPEMYHDKIKALEKNREERINQYIIPVEMRIDEEKEKLKKYYRKKGIH